MGLIPTYAGNTGQAHTHQGRLGAHPHVCGEHILLQVVTFGVAGSSPRMRGTH